MIPKSIDCSVSKYLNISSADRSAYEHLAPFHYREPSLGPFTHLFAMFEEHCRRRIVAPVVGVIAYRPPVPNLAIRNLATGGYFSGLPRAAGLSLLNEHVRCISRVIIEPRYRGLGLASRLVCETLPQTGAAMVEATGVISCFNPFFKRAGMLEYRQPPDVKTERMKTALETVGIEQHLWIDAKIVHRRIEALQPSKHAFLEQQMHDFLQKFARQRHMPHSIDRTDFILSKLGAGGNYYLWLNPEKPIPGLQIV